VGVALVQGSLFPRRVTRDELNSLVDRAADLIRTAVDYKFILVLLFLKRLNDLWKVEKGLLQKRLMQENGGSNELSGRLTSHACWKQE
jgi:type I restriction-modification system DNA methylase subunit